MGFVYIKIKNKIPTLVTTTYDGQLNSYNVIRLLSYSVQVVAYITLNIQNSTCTKECGDSSRTSSYQVFILVHRKYTILEYILQIIDQTISSISSLSRWHFIVIKFFLLLFFVYFIQIWVTMCFLFLLFNLFNDIWIEAWISTAMQCIPDGCTL